MRDAAPTNPLPGWFGVILLDHTTDFSETSAPHRVKVRLLPDLRHQRPGDPGRRTQVRRGPLRPHGPRPARPRPPARPARRPEIHDFSSGPFNDFEPGQTLDYRLAMVIGDGQEEMLANAVKAAEMGRGRWFDLDNNWITGTGGRETKVCLGRSSDILRTAASPCSATGMRLPDEDLRRHPPRMFVYCIGPRTTCWTGRGRPLLHLGQRATTARNASGPSGGTATCRLFDTFSQLHPLGMLPERQDLHRHRRTGNPRALGRNQERPPPPAEHAPGARGQPGGGLLGRRQRTRTRFLRGVIDFESYRIWRVANWIRPPAPIAEAAPPGRRWGMIDEYDVVNFIPVGVGDSPHDRCPGPQHRAGARRLRSGLPERSPFRGSGRGHAGRSSTPIRRAVHRHRPPLRDSQGAVIPGREDLVPWETWPDVLDTFFAVTAARRGRPVWSARRATRYYHHLDTEVHNGFQTLLLGGGHGPRAGLVSTAQWVPCRCRHPEEPGNNYQHDHARARRPDRRRARQARAQHLRLSQPGHPRGPGRIPEAAALGRTTPPGSASCSTTCPRPTTPSRSSPPAATWWRRCTTTASTAAAASPGT